jgi:hypothetical protein
MRKIIAGFLLVISTNLSGQNKPPADTTAVKSIDGILKKMLNIISGEKGKIRDWEAFRNLFLSTANFTVLNTIDSLQQPVETVGLEEFIKMMHDPYYDAGYLEYETGKTVEEYNGLAIVFQSFYGKDSENREEKGINSYQLVFFKNRWWIANLVWVLASRDVPIPGKYLTH